MNLQRHDVRAWRAALAGLVLALACGAPFAAPADAATSGETVPAWEAQVATISEDVDRGEYARARQTAQELLRGAEAEGRDRYIAEAIGYLGVIDRRLGLLDEALQRQRRALSLWQGLHDARGQADAYSSIGNVYRDMGRYPEALEAQLEALKLREQLPGRERLDFSYRRIAILYRELGELATAREYFEKAERAAAASGLAGSLSTVRGTFASLLNDLGEYALAREKAQSALAQDEKTGRNYGAALERIELGRALLGLGLLDQAAVEVDAALAAGERMKQVEIVGRALLHRGEILARQGRTDGAIAALQRSVDVLTDSSLKGHLSDALLQLQQALQQRQDFDAALAVANRRLALNEELFNAQASRRTARLEHAHQQELTRRQIETLERDNRIASLELDRTRYARWLGAALIAFLVVVMVFVFWRNRALGRVNRLLAERAQQVAAANTELEGKSQELYEASIRDPLTGLYNRRYVMQQLEQAVAQAGDSGRDVALLLIDFDHFKRINDSLGHQAGDDVLRSAAELIRTMLGAEGVLGRYGGEELMAVLPDSDRAGAQHSAERLRLLVQSRLKPPVGVEGAVTISIGIATLRERGERDVRRLINEADEALYAAKAAGRNRVCVAARDGIVCCENAA